MTTRQALEEEWQEYQLWMQNRSLKFEDYLDYRDLVTARDNLQTLREFMNGMDDEEILTVAELKELLRYA